MSQCLVNSKCLSYSREEASQECTLFRVRGGKTSSRRTTSRGLRYRQGMGEIGAGVAKRKKKQELCYRIVNQEKIGHESLLALNGYFKLLSSTLKIGRNTCSNLCRYIVGTVLVFGFSVKISFNLFWRTTQRFQPLSENDA